jgi:hypothetical protein
MLIAHQQLKIAKLSSFCLGEGTIHCFHESHAINGYLGGVLYLNKILNNTIYYLIFQFLQFYVCLCLVLI